VHSEGLAERLGEISLLCTGAPGRTLAGNLIVFLPVTVTNRIDANNYATDATVSYLTSTATIPSGVSGLVNGRSITFNGLSTVFPSNGTVSIVISDLRGNVNEIGSRT